MHPSGHNFNKTKSKIIVSKTCHPQIKISLTNLFDINISNSLGMYLGFPITDKKPKSKDYQFLIDRMRFRLNNLNAKWISMAGRNTLASSMLNTLPNHIMQLLLLPSKTLSTIGKVQRDFICGYCYRK